MGRAEHRQSASHTARLVFKNRGWRTWISYHESSSSSFRPRKMVGQEGHLMVWVCGIKRPLPRDHACSTPNKHLQTPTISKVLGWYHEPKMWFLVTPSSWRSKSNNPWELVLRILWMPLNESCRKRSGNWRVDIFLVLVWTLRDSPSN